MDSEYVYGVVEWSAKWLCHGWRCSTGGVGHRDLWEQILWLREAGGDMCPCTPIICSLCPSGTGNGVGGLGAGTHGGASARVDLR